MAIAVMHGQWQDRWKRLKLCLTFGWFIGSDHGKLEFEIEIEYTWHLEFPEDQMLWRVEFEKLLLDCR